jgi:hypothetical protein
MILLRILVYNENQLEAVHVLQDKFKLRTEDGKPLAPFDSAKLPSVPEAGNQAQIWSVINCELTANPPLRPIARWWISAPWWGSVPDSRRIFLI